MANNSKEESRISSMPSPTSNMKPWMLITTLAFFIALGVIYYQWNQNKAQQERLEHFQSASDTGVNENEALRNLAFIRLASTEKIVLSAEVEGQDFALIAYWNNEVKKVLLDPNGVLQAPKGKSYVLWAEMDDEWPPIATMTGAEDNLTKAQFQYAPASLMVTLEDFEGIKDLPSDEVVVIKAF